MTISSILLTFFLGIQGHPNSHIESFTVMIYDANAGTMSDVASYDIDWINNHIVLRPVQVITAPVAPLQGPFTPAPASPANP